MNSFTKIEDQELVEIEGFEVLPIGHIEDSGYLVSISAAPREALGSALLSLDIALSDYHEIGPHKFEYQDSGDRIFWHNEPTPIFHYHLRLDDAKAERIKKMLGKAVSLAGDSCLVFLGDDGRCMGSHDERFLAAVPGMTDEEKNGFRAAKTRAGRNLMPCHNLINVQIKEVQMGVTAVGVSAIKSAKDARNQRIKNDTNRSARDSVNEVAPIGAAQRAREDVRGKILGKFFK